MGPNLANKMCLLRPNVIVTIGPRLNRALARDVTSGFQSLPVFNHFVGGELMIYASMYKYNESLLFTAHAGITD